MRMVPVDVFNNITATNLEWVVDACGGSAVFWCEVWKIADAGWRVHILEDDKLAVEDTRVAVLVRGGGVERCINFGVELELLNQVLSKDVESSLSRSLRRDYPACGPGALVYIWTKVRRVAYPALPFSELATRMAMNRPSSTSHWKVTVR